ncbi:BRO1-domain-containing protein [Violaceomyces palustris]|uniref:BRO1-domain-containing protein n=1 Tax=Violaceomyces palustris TaxID=1673888 RepID=A0ACD0NM77_9BASI|nr:BRO1-domain-containing protein [Violaceomyces palustris]
MPRNILALPPKTSPNISNPLTKAIREYISQNYSDTHPDAFSDDLVQLCRLREESSNLPVHITSVHRALAYHAQLAFISNKFPTNLGVSFPWSLSFPPSLPLWTSNVSSTQSYSNKHASASSSESYVSNHLVAHPDLNYESANVLFSLACLYSALGAAETRGDSDSIKRSIAYFQSAAGILSHVRNNLISEIKHLAPPSPDLNPALLDCLREVMLAQAQECFWQKAVLDRLKDKTIAKLAMQVSEFYGSALDFASPGSGSFDRAAASDTSDPLESTRFELPNDWLNHITVKRWHFHAAAHYRMSCEDLGSNRYGDELGRLKLAESSIKKALDSSKRGVSDAIVEDLRSLQQIISTNLQRGTRDNDLIYLEPVTPASNLPNIAPAAMVKPVLPAEVENPIPLLREGPSPALGQPLFSELVPYGVHLAISIYEDRKDSLIREEINQRREELDAIATSTLQSLNLPGSLQALEQPMGVPASLLRKHEEISAEGGLERLTSMMEDVARISKTDSNVLYEAVSILDEEEKEDERARATLFGGEGPSHDVATSGWNRPRSEVAASDLRAKADQLFDTLKRAFESDNIVREKFQEWHDLIGVLSRGREGLDALLKDSNKDSGQRDLLSPVAGGEDGEEDGRKRVVDAKSDDKQLEAIQALRSELESLDDLLDSRTACMAEAGNVASNDDIRPAVLAKADRLTKESMMSSSKGAMTNDHNIQAAQFEELFEEEMKKYEKFRLEMIRSSEEQEERLERIRQKNQAFLEARKFDVSVKRRERCLQELERAYQKYREISSNLVEGLKFYNDLARLLSSFRQEVKDWTRLRRLELDHLVLQLKERRFGGGGGGGGREEEEAGRMIRPKVRNLARSGKPKASSSESDSPRRSTRLNRSVADEGERKARAVAIASHGEEEEEEEEEEEDEVEREFSNVVGGHPPPPPPPQVDLPKIGDMSLSGKANQPHPRPQPQWGAFPGGEIRFG